MMSLPLGSHRRVRAIATPGVGHLNRLAAMYGGRIFPARAGNTEIGRNGGYLTDRADRPG